MNFKKAITNFDYLLMAIILIIFSVGLVAIASATNVQIDGVTRQFKMQMISFAIGLVIVILMQLVDYEIFGEFYLSIFFVSIALLLLVYIPGLGVVRGGARSWIQIGSIDIQTSELAKIGYIIFFSKFLEKNHGVRTFMDILKCGVILLPFLVLVLKQPDLGSGLVFVLITFGMMFTNGLKYRYIALGGALSVLISPIIYKMMKSHQKERIDAFLNPEDLTLPGNYHVMQSKITIGSGQMYGKGIFQGVYHRLDYLPVQESDFIFAVFAEETGFVGGLALIVLYFMFLLRLLILSYRAKDEFGSNIIVGIIFMFAFQIIENIGMTMGVMPVTGITLPFFSYGASSIVTSMIAIGLVQTIYIRRKKGTFMY
ncbi:rod shape-determining protein RodA [Fusibacter ferrireducens]|uniref:Rod shape-determining protein RodA n=1 Tax=Fusibacter ferrireducens TaxID=2785058 RepID=A0ABR9ZWM2_9FIRM|nr:rod shape-determining protein RodA [Fusibacter ferrireducens]MBF4694872.1 rod shape-determining protein RodA [Fusibacter ferrireducens]